MESYLDLLSGFGGVPLFGHGLNKGAGSLFVGLTKTVDKNEGGNCEEIPEPKKEKKVEGGFLTTTPPPSAVGLGCRAGRGRHRTTRGAAAGGHPRGKPGALCGERGLGV